MDEKFSPELTIDSEGPIRIVTLNRPDELNSANEELHTALAAVWKYLATDAEARVVILTGAGRAFSAGANFEYLKSMWDDEDFRRHELAGGKTLINEMLAFPLPVIAAVNGAAVGLGCSLAVLSDLVLMSDKAFFADTHVAVGLTAADGGAPAWPSYMSLLRAKEYIFTGERISAELAVEFGLANRVVPHDALMDEARILAAKLAALPAQALQSSKRALNMHLQRDVSTVLDYGFAEEFSSFGTKDHQGIVQGYIDKSAAKK